MLYPSSFYIVLLKDAFIQNFLLKIIIISVRDIDYLPPNFCVIASEQEVYVTQGSMIFPEPNIWSKKGQNSARTDRDITNKAHKIESIGLRKRPPCY